MSELYKMSQKWRSNFAQPVFSSEVLKKRPKISTSKIYSVFCLLCYFYDLFTRKIRKIKHDVIVGATKKHRIACICTYLHIFLNNNIQNVRCIYCIMHVRAVAWLKLLPLNSLLHLVTTCIICIIIIYSVRKYCDMHLKYGSVIDRPYSLYNVQILLLMDKMLFHCISYVFVFRIFLVNFGS